MVASDARDPRFESSYLQTFLSDINLFTVNGIEKTKIKNRPEMSYFFSKSVLPSLGQSEAIEAF